MTIVKDSGGRPTGIRIDVDLEAALDIAEAFPWDDEFARDLGRVVAEAEDLIVELDERDDEERYPDQYAGMDIGDD